MTLAPSNWMVKNAYTAVATMGGKSPNCVSSRIEISAPTPMMVRSLSFQSHMVAFCLRLSGYIYMASPSYIFIESS